MPTQSNKNQEQDQANREPGEDGKQWPAEPNPRGWAHNNVAGVAYLTAKEPYEFLIKFNEKPSQSVIDHMKDNGFSWNREEKVWARPIAYKTAAQDRETGRRTYAKVVEMILGEKGLAHEKADEGVSF